MTAVPDGLPSLAYGDHQPGEGKACAMEYVSVLAGEPFSDEPACTNHIIAVVVQNINDALSDTARPRLIPYLERLARSGYDSPELTLAMAIHCGANPPGPADETSSQLWSVQVWTRLNLLLRVPAPWPGNFDAPFRLLDELLDIHDEYAAKAGWTSGRENPVVTPEALARAKALIEGGIVNA